MTDKPEGYVFGRPTKYRPEMCEKVIEWGKLGKSRAWMCAKLDIAYKNLLEWEAIHEDFRNALARAEMSAQLWWEDAGQDNLQLREFNSSVWSRSMAARFPKFWREKTAIVGGDDDDKPVKQETTHIGLDAFSSRIVSLSARQDKGQGDSEPDNGAA